MTFRNGTFIATLLWVLFTLPTFAQQDSSIDRAGAEAIALTQYPDASVVSVERTREYGVRAWDVMLDNGMAVYVNAQTGAIIKLEPWRGEWQGLADSPFIAPLADIEPMDIGTDGVDISEARMIALGFYPDAGIFGIDAGIFGIDLERTNQLTVWDVMLDNGMAVYIDADTGAVIEFELWSNALRGADWEGGAPPWADFAGGRRAWQAERNATGDMGGAVSGTSGQTISREEAVAIALAQFPDTRVVEVKTGREYGVDVWDVELSNGVSLDINMANGDIVEISGRGYGYENPRYDDDWDDGDWDDGDWDDGDWDDDDWDDDDWDDDDWDDD